MKNYNMEITMEYYNTCLFLTYYFNCVKMYLMLFEKKVIAIKMITDKCTFYTLFMLYLKKKNKPNHRRNNNNYIVKQLKRAYPT